jgi:hypothetical protein
LSPDRGSAVQDSRRNSAICFPVELADRRLWPENKATRRTTATGSSAKDGSAPKRAFRSGAAAKYPGNGSGSTTLCPARDDSDPAIASPSDKAPGFTYKGKTYHFTFIPDIYHLTDEADGKHHYFFKFGAEGLEDIHKFPHSTSRKGHDHPLSDLADKDLLKFVQRLFTKTLLHPTALAVKLEQKEKTQKLANELWETGGYNTYADAYADARNA